MNLKRLKDLEKQSLIQVHTINKPKKLSKMKIKKKAEENLKKDLKQCK